MWLEAIRIAAVGFSVVIITLVILAVCVKVMSAICKATEKKKRK